MGAQEENPLSALLIYGYIGWLFLLHTALPKVPYGSRPVRDRHDPRGNWYLPQLAFALAWISMSAGYSYNGYTKLMSPSWLDGSPLARSPCRSDFVWRFYDGRFHFSC